MSHLNQVFGTILRDTRLRAHFSQEDLAEKAGLHRNHISFLERGLRSPTLETLFRICEALDLEPGELVIQVALQLQKSKDIS